MSCCSPNLGATWSDILNLDMFSIVLKVNSNGREINSLIKGSGLNQMAYPLFLWCRSALHYFPCNGRRPD